VEKVECEEDNNMGPIMLDHLGRRPDFSLSDGSGVKKIMKAICLSARKDVANHPKAKEIIDRLFTRNADTGWVSFDKCFTKSNTAKENLEIFVLDGGNAVKFDRNMIAGSTHVFAWRLYGKWVHPSEATVHRDTRGMKILDLTQQGKFIPGVKDWPRFVQAFTHRRGRCKKQGWWNLPVNRNRSGILAGDGRNGGSRRNFQPCVQVTCGTGFGIGNRSHKGRSECGCAGQGHCIHGRAAPQFKYH